jgi:hypothetical protein
VAAFDANYWQRGLACVHHTCAQASLVVTHGLPATPTKTAAAVRGSPALTTQPPTSAYWGTGNPAPWPILKAVLVTTSTRHLHHCIGCGHWQDQRPPPIPLQRCMGLG